jgi:hypothetical protein
MYMQKKRILTYASSHYNHEFKMDYRNKYKTYYKNF